MDESTEPRITKVPSIIEIARGVSVSQGLKINPCLFFKPHSGSRICIRLLSCPDTDIWVGQAELVNVTFTINESLRQLSLKLGQKLTYAIGVGDLKKLVSPTNVRLQEKPPVAFEIRYHPDYPEKGFYNATTDEPVVFSERVIIQQDKIYEQY